MVLYRSREPLEVKMKVSRKTEQTPMHHQTDSFPSSIQHDSECEENGLDKKVPRSLASCSRCSSIISSRDTISPVSVPPWYIRSSSGLFGGAIGIILPLFFVALVSIVSFAKVVDYTHMGLFSPVPECFLFSQGSSLFTSRSYLLYCYCSMLVSVF